MPATLPMPPSQRLALTFEALSRLFALYVIPVAIAFVSLIALLTWDSNYVTHGEQSLTLRVLQTASPLTPADARTALAQRTGAGHYDTRLSEAPVWFGFHVRAADSGRTMVEFPSRHAVDIACWDATTLQPLGTASHANATGALSPVKAGFALALGTGEAGVLCRAGFVGPARLTAVAWPGDQLDVSIRQYHRKSGLLDGGLLVLAIFVLLTALINRQSLYVLFAGWLFLNLRIGALSAGWDIQWLGQHVPEHWLLLMRSITVALYALATLALFRALFREDLAHTRYARPMQIMQWFCIPFLVAAVMLPFGRFLPIVWIMAILYVPLVCMSLAAIVVKSQTRVALWYAASLTVNLVSTLSEVAAAALGMHEFVGIANSVTAALASSVLAALAIAEEMRMEHSRHLAAQAKLEHTFEAMPIGLFTLDSSGRFVSANPALRAILGADVTAEGRNVWQQYFAEGAWSRLHQMVDAEADGELELQSRNGLRRFLVKATLARGKIEGFLQDITDKSKATEDLRFMANNDPLTKVFNRRGIERMYDAAHVRMADGKPLALAYLDLDRFKLINDLFGHRAGDEVLKQVCERISVMLANGQHIGRVGGDEFVITMPDTSIPLAALICRGIVDSIGNTPYRVGDKAFHVRGSIGLIEVSSGTHIQDAISTADRACREAKSSHSDGLVVYEKNAAAFHERKTELDLIGHLSLGTATDGMFLEMQPIMSLKDPHGSLNVEVLLRMRGEDGSTIPAGRIIGAAEKSGRTSVIDRWVMSTTLAWINTHMDELPRTQFICINLSGASLNDERFVQDSIDMLEENVHAAAKLCIEITESVALHDLENTRRFINSVRSYGAKVGLDDFGAGYTSFSYLKELPADVLKIDGSFIVNINAHPANVAIVEAIVNLASNLGMKTIAEWAEDMATVQTLAELGVDYVQGFAIARSQPPADILAAASCASFIRDEQLLELVNTFGAPRGAPAQGELLELVRLRNVQ